MQDKIQPENSQQQAQNEQQPVQKKPKASQPKGGIIAKQRPIVRDSKPTIQAKHSPIVRERKPTIQAKQRPVSKGAQNGKAKETFKLGKNEIDATQMLFDRYYDEEGNFLFEDNKKTDYVKVVIKKKVEDVLKNKGGIDYLYDNTKGTLDEKVKLLQTCSVGIDKLNLSASAYGNIYTNILEKGGYDTYKLYSMSVSVKTANDTYAKPGKSDTEIFTTLGKGERFKITVNHKDGDAFLKKYLNTTSNILNALGAHEYRGHGEKKFGATADPNDRLKLSNHHLAYEEQIFHDKANWAKTTKEFKLKFLDQYEAYLLREDPIKYAKKKPEIDKLRRQYTAQK
ncbi:hypothetical protein [uncultured Microscilla sp.]|uniref:hypothetical protein n=1 Tax=uncultured Microscilla sp. TaxID=432653 RepID=UPI00260F03EA|nr:hypothetical protein [uncultured Microscilla sp.]